MSEESVQNQSHEVVESMDASPTLPPYNFSHSCVNTWTEKMNKGILSCTHFKDHWRIWVPKIYTPEPNSNCLDWVFDEETAQKVLFNTLEEFICNGDPKVVLKELSQMDNVICGRVFKMGEATYSCKECGVDSTCVLCADCFKQSVHRNHKYRMGTSSGGGFCDCGDTEAWKKEPFCNAHLVGIQVKEDHGNKLPGDIAERAVVVFETVLRYCHTMLSLEHTLGLPPDLCFNNTEDDDSLSSLLPSDDYCTVLFNDETHTFDQVISTLIRVMNCTQRDALEFVTNVDRDGRAVVKCANFQQCKNLQNEIEKYTTRHSNSNRPLKVLVVHAHVIAHQIFAMKLLHWLQQLITPCEGFRVLFSNVALNTKLPVISIVEGILMNDSQLWKSARTAWHRLLMSGMLMEYESKKALAIVFTRGYGSIMKDYIRDDHDHSFSIVSFSVQLFTVPTLAHHLIAHHDVLFILLNAFISESSRRCNAAGKLEFERETPNHTFKRALFVLQDLRYLLSSKPDVWTDDLRKSFLQGLSLLLTLLSSMQCMDSVVRQVGQHMEYEPEWESAFNLHIRLSPVISLALQWCGSDQIVLIRAFRLVLRKLHEQPGHEIGPPQVRELADHSATCIDYDVSSEPVSVHLPLSRFLAGLFSYLEVHNLHFQCAEFINYAKPTLEQIIEPVLATQVMIAQVHSGMWKRNGYSLLNQLYFYHNVKCRSEMLDRDIILLQAGASLIECNEFLIHVLNKFNLLQWASPDFDVNAVKYLEDDSIRQTLVEEFLGLLITIIGERYVVGVGQVTTDDILKKEIIQQLCVKPLSHSELSKTLSDDMFIETEMERVIQDIADFKKPSQSSGGKGVYELKPHLYCEYNVFFYHYTKEEVSNSEETQRKRRKALGELECCPPPKLPKLTEGFSLVTNLLQCDVMLHIMQIVLERALNCKPRRFSESQVHKILHLIGYAIQEQESGYYPFFAFTTRAAKWKIYTLLEDLSSSPRIEAHKDLLTWVLTKYREVAGNTVVDTNTMPAAPRTGESAGNENAETDKEWRTKMAAEKRAKIMAQMAAMQKHFMKKNAELFEEATLDVNKSNDQDPNMDSKKCPQKPVALGIGQTLRRSGEETYKTCILCQEDQIVTVTGPAMVLAAFVQQSTVLCQHRANTDEPDPLYLSAKLGASPHTGTCGHVMHVHCWQQYFSNVLAKENRRPFRLRQPASFDVEKQEYLCPLCECLSNTVLLLLPPLKTLQPTPPTQPDIDFSTWLVALRIAMQVKHGLSPNLQTPKTTKGEHDPTCCYCTRSIPCPMKAIRNELGNVECAFQLIYSQHGPSLSRNLMSTIELFAQAAFAKEFGNESYEDDDRVPLLVWKSTAYSIHAIECLLRDMEKPLLGALSSRQRDSLEGLARISAVLGSKCPLHIDPLHTTWADKDSFKNNALSLLTLLLQNPHEGSSVLDWDSFGVLVPLINSLPGLLCTGLHVPIITGGVFEYYALLLVFISLIVKILLTTDFNEEMDVDSQETVEDTFSETILTLVHALNINTGSQSPLNIWRRITKASLPFLRCCALYFHYISDVPAPEELTKVDGATYENICSYLGLPTTCDELIWPHLDVILKLINIWKSHPTVQMHLSGTGTVTIIKEPLKVNELVKLPDDYSELINMISSFTCPNSIREDSRTPTLCLVCGEMLCSQSYCCQFDMNDSLVGACTYHASKCGAGVGLFLRIRECEILLLRTSNRGAFACPPYLDEYGETDQGLRRGNPLRICYDRYKQLNQMWLGHGLYESISRAIESSSNPTSMRWHHL
ncbi:E3 ubiquitin-protein ligase UBR2 [Ceratina calcarata]|uniref:E3 ubiquitin-protein ligase n=1 Tax=Ceratina calcarata TaxID=156304 RepID=A0AAJ7JF86_9HYME|nr:E3 ubiquitin-protein ligase UBR2 [Ceratina calcarata]XP_017891395.1 E3 ubiquitin-protein ligase UBR2 [Ceratina calcarata]